MMTISDQFGTASRRIRPHSPRRERTDPKCRKITEKSHTRLVSRRVATLKWKRSNLAESIVFASKKRLEAVREDEDAGAQSALRPAKPVHQGLDEVFEEALDDAMARFTKALEHLAK